MRRIAAVVGAGVMIVVALVVRGTFDSDSGPGGGRATQSGGGSVICTVELAEHCAEVSGVEEQRAGETADRLIEAVKADAIGAGWIVPAAWARLVIDERARLGAEALFEIDGDPIASSSTVMVIWESRSQQLASICGDVDWRCVAAQDGIELEAGDRVRPGSAEVDSATGLAVAAAQAANLLGRPDYAANDFTGEFNSLATRLAAGVQADPVGTMRSRGPGRVTAAAAVAADAGNLATNFGSLQVVDVPLAARVDVVALVARGSSLDRGVRDRVRDSFTESGWAATAGGPDGLPSGSVLAAIRTLWNDAR